MPTLPSLDKNVNLSPHVVILGAGASIASYLHSGKHGNPPPTMASLIDVLDLRKDIEYAGVYSDGLDFEAFYDDLVTSDANPKLQQTVEARVWEYFSHLILPNRPTIYDYLVVSLREKDLIATFNWDPFLLQAYRRNGKVRRLPRIVFLHGNVGVGICDNDRISGPSGNVCSKCGHPLRPSRLLYPVKHKNYSADPFIKNEWEVLHRFLSHAYYLTIFGYSAPKTDVEARNLMLQLWKKSPTLELAEVDIVDIRPRDVLEENWAEFFVSHHYGIQENILDSYLLKHPRRSCDAFAEATLMLRPWHENPIPQFETIQELHEWVLPLVVEEDKYTDKGDPFSGNPVPPNNQQ